jgi:hypothetical protein
VAAGGGGSGGGGGDDDGSGGELGVQLRLGFSTVTYAAHYDANDTWLASLAGTRRVLLLHPAAAAALRPEANRSHPWYRQAALGFLRELDPAAEPAAALGLAAELRPGDALHIPAGWLHYIEVDPPGGAGKFHAGGADAFWLSMAHFCHADATVQASPRCRPQSWWRWGW